MPRPISASPGNSKRLRVKAGVLFGVIAIALSSIGFNLAGSPMFRPRAKEVQTPQWMAAHRHRDRLRQDPTFVDIDVVPSTEGQAGFKVVGSVRTTKNLDTLTGKLPEVLPHSRYDVDVMTLDPGGGS